MKACIEIKNSTGETFDIGLKELRSLAKAAHDVDSNMVLRVKQNKHELTSGGDEIFSLPEGSSRLAQAIWTNELTKCALELF